MNIPFIGNITYTPQRIDEAFCSKLKEQLSSQSNNLVQTRPYRDGPGEEYATEIISAFQDVQVNRGLARKLLDRETNPPPFGYEIWYDEEKIKFVWSMPDDYWYSELRKIIAGNYPRVGIKRMSKEFPSLEKGQYAAGGRLTLDENIYRPIKGVGSDAHGRFDPEKAALRNITSGIVGQNDSTAIAQVIFTPAGDDWRKRQFGRPNADKIARHLKEGEVVESHVNPYIEDPSEKDLRIAEAILDMEGESAFYVNIRYFVFADDQDFAQKAAASIGNAYYSTYNNPEYGQRFDEIPLTGDELQDELKRAVGREWHRNHGPDGATFPLTHPELAAVAHIPNDDIDTPNVDFTQKALGSQASAEAPRKVTSKDGLPFCRYGQGKASTDDHLTGNAEPLPPGTESVKRAPDDAPELKGNVDENAQSPERNAKLSESLRTGEGETQVHQSATTSKQPAPPSEQYDDERQEQFKEIVDKVERGEITKDGIREGYDESEAENLISLIEDEITHRERSDDPPSADNDEYDDLPEPVRKPDGFDFTPVAVEREWCLDPHTGNDRAYEVAVHTENGNTYMGADVRRELIDIHEEHPESPIWLGYLNDNRVGFHEIGIEESAWYRHMTLFGMTGMGKSTEETTIMNQIVRKGHGLCYIDPKGDTVDDFKHQIPDDRMDDVIWIEPGSTEFDQVVGLNFLEAASEPGTVQFDREVTSIVDDLTSILKGGDYWGPKMEGITTNIARAMLRSEKPFTLLDMYYVLQSGHSRRAFADMVAKEGEKMAERGSDEEIVDDMENIHTYTKQIAEMDYEEVDAVVRRIQHWVEDPISRAIVAHRQGTVNITEAVEEDKIILVKINIDSEDIKQVVSTAIMRRIWAAIKAREEDEDDRSPFFTFIDEFDDVASEEMAMEKMLSKARSGKMGVFLANQNPGQIPENAREQMFANTRTMASFGVGEPGDAKLISTRFTDEVDREDIMNIPQFTMFTRILLEGNEGPKLSKPLPINSFPDYPPVRSPKETHEFVEHSLNKYGVDPLDASLNETAMLIHDLGNDEQTQRQFLQAVRQIKIEREEQAVSLRAVNEEFQDRTGRSIDDYPNGLEINRDHFRMYVPVDDDDKPSTEKSPSASDGTSVTLDKLSESGGYKEVIGDGGGETHTIGSTEGAVTLTKEGLSFILKADEANFTPSESHREMLARSFDWFTRANFKVEIIAQSPKQDRPDAKGELPGEIDYSSPIRTKESIEQLEEEYPLAYSLSDSRDITIEAEKSLRKPAGPLHNLARASNAEQKCMFTVPDGRVEDHDRDYYARRLDNILRDPAYVKREVPWEDENGNNKISQILYNKTEFLELTEDDDEEKYGLIKKGKQCVWEFNGNHLLLYDGADGDGSQRARILPNELENASANAFDSWVRYDKYEDEWVVYTDGPELRYDSIEEVEEEWQRVRQPFFPEHEFNNIPGEDGWEIIVTVTDDDLVEIPQDTMPLVYNGDNDSLNPLIPEEYWDRDFEETFSPELLRGYDCSTTSEDPAIAEDDAPPSHQELYDNITSYYMSSKKFLNENETLPRFNRHYTPRADFGGKEPLTRLFWEGIWDATNTDYDVPIELRELKKGIKMGAAMRDNREEAIESAVKGGHLIHSDVGFFLAPPRGNHAKLVLPGDYEEFISRDMWEAVWEANDVQPGESLPQGAFATLAKGAGPFTGENEFTQRIEAAVTISLTRDTLETVEMDTRQSGYRLPARDPPEEWVHVWTDTEYDRHEPIPEVAIAPAARGAHSVDIDTAKEQVDRALETNVLYKTDAGIRLNDPSTEDGPRIDWASYEGDDDDNPEGAKEDSTDVDSEFTEETETGALPEATDTDDDTTNEGELEADGADESLESATEANDEGGETNDVTTDEETSLDLENIEDTADDLNEVPSAPDDEEEAPEGPADAEGDDANTVEETDTDSELLAPAEPTSDEDTPDDVPDVDSKETMSENSLAAQIDFLPSEEPDGWRDAFDDAIDYYQDRLENPLGANQAFNGLIDHLVAEYAEACGDYIVDNIELTLHQNYLPHCKHCRFTAECDGCGSERPVDRIDMVPCHNSGDEDKDTMHGIVEVGCDYCHLALHCAECVAAHEAEHEGKETDPEAVPLPTMHTSRASDSANDTGYHAPTWKTLQDEFDVSPSDLAKKTDIPPVEDPSARLIASTEDLETLGISPSDLPREAREGHAGVEPEEDIDEPKTDTDIDDVDHSDPLKIIEFEGCWSHVMYDSSDCNFCTTHEHTEPFTQLPESPHDYFSGPHWELVDLIDNIKRNPDRHNPHRHLGDPAFDAYGRQWDGETVEEARVGWAPTGYDPGVESLLKQGYTAKQLIATGLFKPDWANINCYLSDTGDSQEYDQEEIAAMDLSDVDIPEKDKVKPRWTGRYVFPYFNSDGEPVHAISRTQKGRPHPGDSNPSAKYQKIPVRDFIYSEEPIYGTDSVRNGEAVVITEGIADAIAAHAHGIPCISPVTVQFKDDDKERLLNVLDEHNVPAAYIVQDNERADYNLLPKADRISSDEWETAISERSAALTDNRVEEYISEQRTGHRNDRHGPISKLLEIGNAGAGEAGALETAMYLQRNGYDAYHVELPRIAGRKVDLDDYLSDQMYEYAPPLPGLTALVETWRTTDSAVSLADVDAGIGATDRLTTGALTDRTQVSEAEATMLQWLSESTAYANTYCAGLHEYLPQYGQSQKKDTADTDEEEENQTPGNEIVLDEGTQNTNEQKCRPIAYSEELELTDDQIQEIKDAPASVPSIRFDDWLPHYQAWRNEKADLINTADTAVKEAREAGEKAESYSPTFAQTGLGRFLTLGRHVAAASGEQTTRSDLLVATSNHSLGESPEATDGAQDGDNNVKCDSAVRPLYEGLSINRPEDVDGFEHLLAENAQRNLTDAIERRPKSSDDTSRDTSGGANRNELFQFDITHLTGMQVGERGRNPLSHIGDSEDYFRILDRDAAYDHKRKATYNPLSYLAVNAGVRDIRNPEGPFSDKELLDTWVTIKRETTYLSKDAKIPRRAFLAAAIDLGTAERSDFYNEEVQKDNGTSYMLTKLPSEKWNATVEAFKDEYGVDPGYSTHSTHADYHVDDLTKEDSVTVFAEHHITDEKSPRKNDDVDFIHVRTAKLHTAYKVFCRMNDIEPRSLRAVTDMVDAVDGEKTRKRINGEENPKTRLIGSTLSDSGWKLFHMRNRILPEDN